MGKEIGYETAIGSSVGFTLSTESRLAHEFARLAANSETPVNYTPVMFETRHKDGRLIIVALVNDQYGTAFDAGKVKAFLESLPTHLKNLAYILTTETVYPTSATWLNHHHIPKRAEIGFRSVEEILADPYLDRNSEHRLPEPCIPA